MIKYIKQNFKFNKPLDLYSKIAMVIISYSIISTFTRMIYNDYLINKTGIYPIAFNLFNSNIYIGFALCIQVINLIFFGPLLEELIYRYWIRIKDLKFRLLIFNAFVFHLLFSLFYFLFPNIDKFIDHSITNTVFKNSLNVHEQLVLTLVNFYLIPFGLSVVLTLILQYYKILEYVKNFEFKLIKNNYNLLIIISSLLFSFNHLELNILNINILSLQLFYLFAVRFARGVIYTQFQTYISFKFSVYFHSFNNSMILLSYAILWKNENANYYTLFLSVWVIVIIVNMYNEYKKAILKLITKF